MDPSAGTYSSIVGETRSEITIKRSLFIACLQTVEAKDEALAYLSARRAEFHDAAHHCWAYRLGPTGQESRSSDDGEPSGSAGKPMLFCMQRAQVTDAILVVIRYFGGIKLGVGGLARAYTEAAQLVLTAAPVRVITPMRHVMIHCGYDDVARITTILQELGAPINPMFGDAVFFDVSIPATAVDRCLALVTERTHGRAGCSLVDSP